jgi:hypothetical protein
MGRFLFFGSLKVVTHTKAAHPSQIRRLKPSFRRATVRRLAKLKNLTSAGTHAKNQPYFSSFSLHFAP